MKGAPLLCVALLLSGCSFMESGTDGIVAEAAMPGYLDQFKAEDGLLTVPQLPHDAAAAGGDPSMAGDMKATYLYLMIETMIGRPFVDEQLASSIDAYGASRSTPVELWERQLQKRASDRFRGRLEPAERSSLSWIPELGGDGGKYLPDMALVCLDLGVEPPEFTVVGRRGAGPEAHALVARWVASGRVDQPSRTTIDGWRDLVRRGPVDHYREYLLAATSLVLVLEEDERRDVVAQVGQVMDEDRGVDDVPWLVPERAGATKGDLLASLAGVYFDIAVMNHPVRDHILGVAEYTTYDGTHL